MPSTLQTTAYVTVNLTNFLLNAVKIIVQEKATKTLSYLITKMKAEY